MKQLPKSPRLLDALRWQGSAAAQTDADLSHSRVEILAQQVVGLHPVVVDQDDGGLPPLEETAEALGDEAAGPSGTVLRTFQFTVAL